MFDRRIFREREINAQRLRQTHQIVETFQALENRLRAQIVFFERLAVLNAPEQRVHVFIDLQALGQLSAIVVAQFILQLFDQRINRRDMGKMQHRLGLTGRMADKRRQRGHRTVTVWQHFGADNRINRGRFPRLHGPDDRQHHLETGNFA
ncbi:hypothetical protein D3C87_1667560 [compost metagenome]